MITVTVETSWGRELQIYRPDGGLKTRRPLSGGGSKPVRREPSVPSSQSIPQPYSGHSPPRKDLNISLDPKTAQTIWVILGFLVIFLPASFGLYYYLYLYTYVFWGGIVLAAILSLILARLLAKLLRVLFYTVIVVGTVGALIFGIIAGINKGKTPSASEQPAAASSALQKIYNINEEIVPYYIGDEISGFVAFGSPVVFVDENETWILGKFLDSGGNSAEGWISKSQLDLVNQ